MALGLGLGLGIYWGRGGVGGVPPYYPKFDFSDPRNSGYIAAVLYF